MNKNTSMSYYFNKITDLIKNKVYVENGPLESHTSSNLIPGMNDIKKIPYQKETEKKILSKNADSEPSESKTTEITENSNLQNNSCLNSGLPLETNTIQIQQPDVSLRDILKTEFNVKSYFRN